MVHGMRVCGAGAIRLCLLAPAALLLLCLAPPVLSQQRPSAVTQPAQPGSVRESRERASRPAGGENPENRGAEAERKSIPPEEAGSAEEGALIEGHTAWRWHLLTYPKKTIPSQPFTKAKFWIENHVPQGEPWPGAAEGLESLGCEPEAVTPPGVSAWVELGPKPIDMSTQPSGHKYGKVTGRYNALAVDPRTTGSPGAIVAYAGGASGGFWKTSNCCTSSTTWTSLWDNTALWTQAVGAIEIDPTNPDVVYVGTGDFNAADQFGEGILKSTDAGATWSQYAADVFTPYAAGTPLWGSQNIGVIKVDPNNPNNVLAGTRFDLYISHDAGVTWTRCPFGANPTDPTSASNPIKSINRISGILVDPSTNPTTVYVAVGYVSTSYNGNNGVYKGTIPNSGCPSLTLKASGWPAGTGNGTNGATNVGRIRLTSSRGNGTGNLVIYAQVQDATKYNALGTWVTTNQGAGWTQLTGSADASYKNCYNQKTNEAQDWYDLFVQADPSDDKTLYIGRTSLYKAVVNSTYTRFSSLTDLGSVYSTTCTGYGTIHPDQHAAAWVSGTGSTARFLVGNDGGVYLATGAVGGFTAMNSMNATQWYAGQISANFAGGGTQYTFAGAQDNGNASWDSSTSDKTWKARSNGGDGFFAAFDPIAGTLSAGNWFTEYTNGALYRSTAGASGSFSSITWGTGDRKAWSTPFLLDNFHCTAASCPNFLIGSQYLYVSSAAGSSLTKAGSADLTKGSGSIIALDVAKASPAAAVVGTDDGNVQVSFNVYTGSNCTQAAANGSSFSCSPNSSAAWVNLTQGNAVLPNRAINGVTFDPTTTNTVYAAVGGFNPNTPSTPGHVFRAVCTSGCTSSSSWTWQDKTGNLPDVPAEAVVANPNNPKQVFLGTDFGLFYTNDITAASPLWYAFNYGLPSTIIKYLNVDRGPSTYPYASTTLAAFTYGRGTYVIRLPQSGAGLLPNPVPPTMTAVKNGTSVDVTYNATSCPNVTNNIYWGSIGNYSAVTGGQCGIGNTGAAASVAIPDNSWFVVAGSDGASRISSFGKDSSGNEESFSGWQGVSGCTGSTQDFSTACP
jgi:hypothetical protein